MAAVAFALVIFSCAESRAVLRPGFGGSITVAIPERVSKLDPVTLTQDHDLMIAGCIYDTLLKPGAGGSLIPVLLESVPEKSKNGLVYTFKLKEGLKFHDGSPLDTADVLNTFKRLASSQSSPYSWLVRDIAGVFEFKKGKAGTISGIRIIDALRFEITLKRQQPKFLVFLCFPALYVVPSSDRNFEPPVGTGPFRYIRKSAKGDIFLSANKEYFLGRPYLDAITFRPIKNERDRLTEFKRGAVDFADVPLGGLTKEERDAFGAPVQYNLKRTYFLDVNPAFPTMSGAGRRIALSRMIDRTDIVKIILNGDASPENNVSGSGEPGGLRKYGENAPRMELWYDQDSQALRLVAEKLQLNFTAGGLAVTPLGRRESEMQKFGRNEAPAFILRSIPIFMGLPESFDSPLTDGDYISRFSAMGRKYGLIGAPADRSSAAAVITIFSRKPSFTASRGLYGVENGPIGVPCFDDAYVREPDR